MLQFFSIFVKRLGDWCQNNKVRFFEYLTTKIAGIIFYFRHYFDAEIRWAGRHEPGWYRLNVICFFFWRRFLRGSFVYWRQICRFFIFFLFTYCWEILPLRILFCHIFFLLDQWAVFRYVTFYLYVFKYGAVTAISWFPFLWSFFLIVIGRFMDEEEEESLDSDILLHADWVAGTSPVYTVLAMLLLFLVTYYYYETESINNFLEQQLEEIDKLRTWRWRVLAYYVFVMKRELTDDMQSAWLEAYDELNGLLHRLFLKKEILLRLVDGVYVSENLYFSCQKAANDGFTLFIYDDYKKCLYQGVAIPVRHGNPRYTDWYTLIWFPVDVIKPSYQLYRQVKRAFLDLLRTK